MGPFGSHRLTGPMSTLEFSGKVTKIRKQFGAYDQQGAFLDRRLAGATRALPRADFGTKSDDLRLGN
jgi:hypothetical protein